MMKNVVTLPHRGSSGSRPELLPVRVVEVGAACRLKSTGDL